MATKQEVADYINNINILDTLTDSELVHIQERVDPLLANALIKIVGDVSWLV